MGEVLPASPGAGLYRQAVEAMTRRLLVVEDAFIIKGRGLVLVPGFIPQDHERFRVGDPITQRRPDGSSLAWRMDGIELVMGPVPRYDLHILLTGLDKDDVPIGTEVWSADA
jgi:hypothetical protein